MVFGKLKVTSKPLGRGDIDLGRPNGAVLGATLLPKLSEPESVRNRFLFHLY